MPMRERLVHARLQTLLTSMQVSGELAYRRRLGLAELPRRIVTLIGGYGGLTSVEIVALTGSEKAQVSRAVKALGEGGLVVRPSLRAPILLSEAGVREFERIMAVGRDRNRALARGIAPADVARFRATTLRLIERAALMLVEERQRSEAAAEGLDVEAARAALAEPPPFPERVRLPDPARPLTQMVVPPLITLVSYLERSATIAYRRETNLTNFGWRVLSQIGEHSPVTLARLIALVGNDKSQVGRAVRRLEETGAIARRRVRGRRDILLAPTAEGERTYAQMCALAIRRDDHLFAGVADAERERYVAVLEALTVNAEALLAAERGKQRAG